jgi:hypothetical protein
MLADDDDLKKRFLCFHCVGEAFLKSEIEAKGQEEKCSYCARTAKSYSIGEMSERIERVFDEHYIRTPDEPDSWQYTMAGDKESDYQGARAGVPVVYAITDAAEMPVDAACDIQQILEEKFSDYDAALEGLETEFSSDSYYEEKGTNDAFWQGEWRQFERSLKTQERFFNQSGAKHLASIFDGIDTMQTLDGRPMIVDAGPDTSLGALYRARVFQSDDKLEVALARPDKHIGPPPSAFANAGRMNAHGISVFYGASDPTVALAEVRPPVGSQVAVARFEIVRPIRLLDLTALGDVTMRGSIFDPTFNQHLERAMFLRGLSRRITVPVMPDDEAFEYLATQAIADFLATETTIPVDGIIFPSVQVAGKAQNIVLFHEAARVEEIDLPEGTDVSVSFGQMYEEGWEIKYTVIEEIPPKTEEPEKKSPTGFRNPTIPHAGSADYSTPDERPPTLKIDLESIKVHIIKVVEFTAKEHSVHRYRCEKREPPSF